MTDPVNGSGPKTAATTNATPTSSLPATSADVHNLTIAFNARASQPATQQRLDQQFARFLSAFS